MMDPREIAPDLGTSSVLVVDDAPANLVAMKALLADLPCDVVLSSSGGDALDQMSRRRFAVVLLDVMMPGMDGYEVARLASSNEITRGVPIIFLTAMNQSEVSAVRGYGSGAVDFLFKPVNATILRSKVQVFLELNASRQKLRDANAALERSLLELKSTQAQLVQSAKMASLGELVAGIAHEINNPLAFVLSHLDTVRRSLEVVGAEIEPRLSQQAAQHWQRARERQNESMIGLNRIRELVVQLRTFSRVDEGIELRTVSFREAIDSVLTILRHRLRDRIEVRTHFSAPDKISCHPGLLNQVLVNLVANAIDAMGEAGTLSLGTTREGDEMVIAVRDTGRGIPPQLIQRVFEPFFTTKPVGKGTGIGLAIAYALVRRHGGTLELESVEGRGTVARIRLPQGSSHERRADDRGRAGECTGQGGDGDGDS